MTEPSGDPSQAERDDERSGSSATTIDDATGTKSATTPGLAKSWPTTPEPAQPTHPDSAKPPSPAEGKPATPGGEVRRQLDRPPGDRFRTPEPPTKPPPSRSRRMGAAVVVAAGAAVVTFGLVTFDIGPGLLVVGIAGGWLTGLAITGGARAGKGDGAGAKRAVTAAALAAAGIALGLLLDALRAYAIGGVLLPWEYAVARFGWIAPAAIMLAAVAGALRGR